MSDDPVDSNTCGLLQLKHTGDLSQFYGIHYGYRSALNGSMVKHLKQKVLAIENFLQFQPGDWIVDIGSNDSTTLQHYTDQQGLRLLGIDPTGQAFKKYYPPHIDLIPDFFSAEKFLDHTGGQKARVITSFSMFYDLPEPLAFMHDIRSCLAENGIWIFEQSYLPLMLQRNAYDTVCHEHLEYYRLYEIEWMAKRAGLKLLDIEFNEINGGSFSVVACLAEAGFSPNRERIEQVLRNEIELGLNSVRPYVEFKSRVEVHRETIRDFFKQTKKNGEKVFGYGASTKGNVLLQYCGLTSSDMSCIAEVNKDKWGAYTPGSLIPIVSELEAKQMKPDYFFVLPWHFRSHILEREHELRNSGTRFVFPFPTLETV